MKDYKKNYWPLVAWVLALLPAMLGSATIAERAGLDDRGIVAAMMVVELLMLLVMMWMIWKGEHVYWFSGGPSFEEAKAAGSDVRCEYAWKHLIAMLRGCVAALVLLAAEYFAGVHVIWMILSTAVCIIASAFSTMKIRWAVNGDGQEN